MKHAHIWSNLAFLLPAYLALPENPTLCLAWVYLVIMSSTSHHSGDWRGDWIAMYTVFAVLLSTNAGPSTPVSPYLLVTVPLLYTVACYMTWFHRWEGYWVIGLFWTGSVVAFFYNGGDTYQGLAGIALFTLALVIRQLAHTHNNDLQNPWTNVGHSVWHVLAAIGGALIRL